MGIYTNEDQTNNSFSDLVETTGDMLLEEGKIEIDEFYMWEGVHVREICVAWQGNYWGVQTEDGVVTFVNILGPVGREEEIVEKSVDSIVLKD